MLLDCVIKNERANQFLSFFSRYFFPSLSYLLFLLMLSRSASTNISNSNVFIFVYSFIWTGNGQQQQQYFAERPQNTSVRQGQMAILRCRVANQQGRVQWTQNGLALGEFHLFSLVILLWNIDFNIFVGVDQTISPCYGKWNTKMQESDERAEADVRVGGLMGQERESKKRKVDNLSPSGSSIISTDGALSFLSTFNSLVINRWSGVDADGGRGCAIAGIAAIRTPKSWEWEEGEGAGRMSVRVERIN